MRRPDAYNSIESGNMTSPNQVPELGVKSHIDHMLRILSPPECPIKSNLKKVFGIPLKDAISHQGKENRIPYIIIRICEYIEKNGLHCKGIFRISGHTKTVEALRMSFETHNDADLETTNDVIATANLLKNFLRELPEAIIPDRYLGHFLQVQADNTTNESEEYVRQLKKLVEQLPEENFASLRYLMSFLNRVASHADDNLMTPLALGIVFGPNIFRIPDNLEGLQMAKIVNQIVTTFIIKFCSIFETDVEIKAVQHDVKVPLVCDNNLAPITGLELDDEEKSDDSLSSSSSQKDTYLVDIGLNDSFSDPTTGGSPESDSDISSSSTTTTSPNVAVVSHNFVEMAISKSKDIELEIPKDSFKKENINGKDVDLNGQEFHSEAKHGKLEVEMKKEKTVCQENNKLPKFFVSEALDNVISTAVPDAKRQMWTGNGDEDSHQSKRSVERSQMFQRLSSSKIRKTRKNVRKSHSLGDLKDEFDDDSLKENENREISESQYKHLHKMGHKKQYAFHHKDSCMSLSLDFDPVNDRPSHPFLELHPQVQTKEKLLEDPQSPSPGTTRKPYLPPLDLTILHEHGDGDEPIPTNRMRASWSLSRTEAKVDDVMLSPRTSQLKKKESDYLDPSIPPSPPAEQEVYVKNVIAKTDETINASMKELNKRIYGLKKTIRQFEDSFEHQHGYKPSHADKMAQSSVKKCMAELSKARKDMKQLREDALKAGLAPYLQSNSLENSEINFKSLIEGASGISSSNRKAEITDSERIAMEDSLEEMITVLAEKRRIANRPEDLKEMDNEQVQDEKIAIQKSLLHFESIFGRPTTRTEKDVMKPIYDRYRSVKRMLMKQNSAKTKDQSMELQPILEHEAMDFVQTSPQHRSDVGQDIENTSEQQINCMTTEVNSHTENQKEDSGGSTSAQKNLHELTIPELLEQHQKVKGEKKRLRRVLREFENAFQRQTGRRVQREDRAPLEAVYSEYKQIKANLRLLEALLSKHSPLRTSDILAQ